MINLKEAGRYSNFLQEMINKIGINLRNIKTFDVIQEHRISEAVVEKQDKTIEVINENYIDTTVEKLEELLTQLLDEKLQLSDAIAFAKKHNLKVIIDNKSYPYDTAIEMAKTYRQVVSGFYSPLSSSKDSTTETRDYGTTFNVEGNQVKFEYPVTIKRTVCFDKEHISKRANEIKDFANKLSVKAEEIASSAIIDFEMKFNYLSTFEELL